MFIIAGPKYDRYVTTSKKISPLALKSTKLERFKVKWHKFVKNMHKNGSHGANFEGSTFVR